ncbi:MAG: glycosyltransferase family 39 protein, partial [Pseudomonadota bacterium]
MASSAAPPLTDTAPAPLTPQPAVSDPWGWCLVIPALFAALASIRLTIPTTPFFDEVHYLPAAREFLKIGELGGADYINREHPLLAKELIALAMYLLGDNPLGWRIAPLIAGTVAVGASMRALWHASGERFATIAFGVLLASGFHLFVHARIAMLDIFMAAFLALAAWQFAAAAREPE